MKFKVTREIGIDAGHRVMTHGSKCRHIHGHRYTVQVTCEAETLHVEGEQTDMVLDFGFLKDLMMEHIDEPCDHGFIACVDDVDVLSMFHKTKFGDRPSEDYTAYHWIKDLKAEIENNGHCLTTGSIINTKLYVVPFIPTAECLAKHWFERLREPVQLRSGGVARVVKVTVWETPNCHAEYSEE